MSPLSGSKEGAPVRLMRMFLSATALVLVSGFIAFAPTLNVQSPASVKGNSALPSPAKTLPNSPSTRGVSAPPSGQGTPVQPNADSHFGNAAVTPPPYPLLQQGSTGPGVVRLQQLLAHLGYLPLTWRESAAEDMASDSQRTYIQHPPQGTWRWTYSHTPSSLVGQWSPGKFNVVVVGAVMTFQQANRLTADGVAGPEVWSRLLLDWQNGKRNPYGYTYVDVFKHQPQTLVVWWNGSVRVTTRVNTGIAASPTVSGTYPVYQQYRSQTMSGVDPWGNHYSDPGIPYVSYFYKGEAVHGFERGGYGYPQSLGCVELPVSSAAKVWPYMHLGTLVSVHNA